MIRLVKYTKVVKETHAIEMLRWRRKKIFKKISDLGPRYTKVVKQREVGKFKLTKKSKRIKK